MRSASASYLQNLLNHDSGFRLMRAQSAPFVISFLYSIFREKHIQVITNDNFETKLVVFLQNHLEDERELLDEMVEEIFLQADILYRAKCLTDHWCSDKKEYIRRYHNQDKVRVIELDPGIERLFGWIEKAESTGFVGTESGFQDIMYKLRSLNENMNADPELRILALEEKKAELEQEIKEIKSNGTVKTLSRLQIQEALGDVLRRSKELLSDFTQIEENFRATISEITRKQTEQSASRGDILGYTLDTNKKLQESPQGQSFNAFWNYMIQDTDGEMNTLCATVFESAQKNGVLWDDEFILNLRKYLYRAGQKVVEKNRNLTERMNRSLLQKERSDKKLITALIADIKMLSKAIMDNDGCELKNMTTELETAHPSLFFPQARVPTMQTAERFFQDISFFDSAEAGLNGFLGLINQFFVDEKLLKQQLAAYRKSKAGMQFTLAELLQEYPLTKGLAEVVTWFSMVHAMPNVLINPSEKDTVHFVKEEKMLEVTIPRMIFT